MSGASSTSRRFNVAHVLPWPTVGGVERATLRLAQALPSDRFSHVFYCLQGAAVQEIARSAGFETEDYRPPEISYRRPVPFLRASRKLATQFKRRHIDLVHCSDVLAAYYAAVAGALARVPILGHVRCRFEDIPLRNRLVLNLVRKFVFVSNDTWRWFGYHVSPRRGVVVRDGINADDAASDDTATNAIRIEFGIAADAPVIGTLGHIAPVKDYVTLAKAAARVVRLRPDARFLVVGDHSTQSSFRDHYAEIRRLVAELGLDSHVVFAGFRDDVSRLIHAMDVVVLSSHAEGLPLSILEAMAQAKPVVATRVGGIPEIIADGVTGLLHAHGDDASLAARILSLLEDKCRAGSLARAGQEFVRTELSIKQFAGKMTEVYMSLLPTKLHTNSADMPADDREAIAPPIVH